MNVRTELLPLEGTIRLDDKNKYLENHYASTGIASLTGICLLSLNGLGKDIQACLLMGVKKDALKFLWGVK